MKTRLAFGPLFLLTTILIVLFSPPAGAQTEDETADETEVESDDQIEEVEGATDYRVPPLLGPGRYSDTIVTGEAVWYAVLYTDDTPYRFEVTLADIDLSSEPDLRLETRFITPTLADAQRGSDLLEGEGLAITSGVDDSRETFRWFIEVSLVTDGRLGVEHELLLDIDGVLDAGFEACPEVASCNLDDVLPQRQERLENAENLLAAVQSGGAEAVEGEISDLEGEIETAQQEIEGAGQRLEDAEEAEQAALDRIGELCSPEPDCDVPPDPGSLPPLWTLAAAGVLLLAGLGFLFTRWRLAR